MNGNRMKPFGRKRTDLKVGYLMLAPIIILLSVFVIIPLIYAASVSFYEWNFYQDSKFIGWHNYYVVLTDPAFRKSIWIGLKFALYVIPAQFVISFLFAHILKSMKGKLGALVKTSIYVPTVVSGIVASVIFIFIYDYQGGIANYLLGIIGGEPIAWLSDPVYALIGLSMPAIWLGFGISTLIMLAGLNDIPEDYYEAAEIDGAGRFRKLTSITVPLMKNVFLFVLVTGMTAAIQQFELPFMMTNGGPLNETMTPNLFIFTHFRGDPYLGYTISSSLLLFLILGFVSTLIFKTINSDKAIDS